MKNLKKILGIWLLMLVSSFSVWAQFTETREFEKRFSIQPQTRIEITNKYGLVELNTWPKDSVVIKVEMKVEEKKLTKLEKTLDEVKFDFTNSPHFLIARTLVGENRSSLENELIKFKETLTQTDGSVTVNYQVWLPDKHPIKVENKFGDILLLNDYSGDVNIDLSNGKLRSKKLGGKFELNLNFADATLGNVINGRITSNYSDLYIKQSDRMRIDSKSSTFDILQVKSLDINSRRDKYRIRLIDEFDAEGNFSLFNISNLQRKANIRTSYGDIDMENIASAFDNIYIESKSTDMNLFFDMESKFNFEITETKSTLEHAREVKETNKTVIDEKEKKIRHNYTFGEKPKGEEKLIINAVGGQINIQAN